MLLDVERTLVVAERAQVLLRTKQLVEGAHEPPQGPGVSPVLRRHLADDIEHGRARSVPPQFELAAAAAGTDRFETEVLGVVAPRAPGDLPRVDGPLSRSDLG